MNTPNVRPPEMPIPKQKNKTFNILNTVIHSQLVDSWQLHLTAPAHSSIGVNVERPKCK